jgi:hypothetical protein
MIKRREAAKANQKEPTGTRPTAKSFEKANPEWLPLHVAMMRFFPTYTTAKAFPNEVKRLVAVLSGPDDFSVMEIAPYVVRIASGGGGLVLDAERGEIEADAGDGDEWAPIFGDFPRLSGRLLDRFPVEIPASAPHPAERLHDLALGLRRSLKSYFREAVEDGGAEIFGRWRDLKAPFEPVYPDIWGRLRIASPAGWSPGTDMSTFTNDGRPGDLDIYSIHVQPHRKQQSPSNRASIACKTFFVEEISKQSTNGRVIQSALKDAARERWTLKELSDGEINRCLTSAKSETKSEGLVRRGRPPKIIPFTQ